MPTDLIPTPFPTTAPAAAVAFRPFTKEDWYGFAGAECFADDAEPILADGHFTLGDTTGWLLILDATGGCLLVDNDPQNYLGGYALRRPFASPAEAEGWFRAAVAGPASLADFFAAGFVRH